MSVIASVVIDYVEDNGDTAQTVFRSSVDEQPVVTLTKDDKGFVLRLEMRVDDKNSTTSEFRKVTT